MKGRVRLLSFVLTILLLINSLTPATSIAAEKVTVDYNEQSMTVAVTKMNDVYMVPLNDIIKAWGGSTKLNSKKTIMTAKIDDLTIIITNGSKTAKIRKEEFTMKNPAVLKKSIMYVTIDLFTEGLGIKAKLNKAKTSVILSFKAEDALASSPPLPVIPQIKPLFTYKVMFKGFYNADKASYTPSLESGLVPSINQSSMAKAIMYYARAEYSGLMKDVNIPITIKYYKEDGTVFGTLNQVVAAKKGNASFNINTGVKVTKGSWPIGTYTVDVYFWDKRMDRQQFKIFTLEADQMDGTVWYQQDGNGIEGEYAFLLKDGYIYFGFQGDAASIYNNEGGFRASKSGTKYKMKYDKLIIYDDNGNVVQEFKRYESSVWIGTGTIAIETEAGTGDMPSMSSISIDGEYKVVTN